MRLEPQGAGLQCRINCNLLPPCGFVAAAMYLAMVSSAQRDGELIADLAPGRSALRESQMVGIRGLTAANQTGLPDHISYVIAVPHPARLGQRQHTLIDRL